MESFFIAICYLLLLIIQVGSGPVDMIEIWDKSSRQLTNAGSLTFVNYVENIENSGFLPKDGHVVKAHDGDMLKLSLSPTSDPSCSAPLRISPSPSPPLSMYLYIYLSINRNQSIDRSVCLSLYLSLSLFAYFLLLLLLFLFFPFSLRLVFFIIINLRMTTFVRYQLVVF